MNKFLVSESDLALAGGISGTPPLAVEPGTAMTSRVGNAVCIKGEISCEQDLFIDGEVNGTLTLLHHKLIIGPQATVKASIKAQNVVIVGTVEGNVEASERIELRGSCRLLGDIRSPRLMIENGAYLKGSVEVTRVPRAVPSY